MLDAYLKVLNADLGILMLLAYPVAFGTCLLARRRILAPAEYKSRYRDVMEVKEQDRN